MNVETASPASQAGVPAASPSGGAPRLIAVDALRGLGALAVVTYHSATHGGRAHYPVRYMGVLHQDLDFGLLVFFVISGALIGGPFITAMIDGRRRPSLGNFAVRRCARIFPAFWVALVGMLLVTSAPLPWWQPVAHAALLQNVIPGQMDKLIYPAWTLEIEASFYVGIAVVAWVVFRRGIAVSSRRAATVVLALWAASLAVTVVADTAIAHGSSTSTPATMLKFTIPGQLAYICPGLLLAIASTRAARAEGGVWLRLDRLINAPRRLLAATFVFFLIGAVMSAPTWGLLSSDLHREPFAVAATLLVAGAIRHEDRLARWARWLLPIGLVTYSFYLWHVVVIQALQNAGIYNVHAGLLSWPLRWAMLCGVTLAVAWASYLLVERPALRWSIRRGQIRALGAFRAGAAAVAPAVAAEAANLATR